MRRKTEEGSEVHFKSVKYQDKKKKRNHKLRDEKIGEDMLGTEVRDEMTDTYRETSLKRMIYM